jgi:hypothetical protein
VRFKVLPVRQSKAKQSKAKQSKADNHRRAASPLIEKCDSRIKLPNHSDSLKQPRLKLRNFSIFCSGLVGIALFFRVFVASPRLD